MSVWQHVWAHICPQYLQFNGTSVVIKDILAHVHL